jgi:CheY-like chemotaxis protein
LLQVFWNFLSNAVRFTPANGRIEVRGSRVGAQVEIAISDTGIGLTPEFLPFAFERFRQGDQSFTRAHSGLGLGLSIVKHLIELHGGEVSAESAGAGRGATFRVRLPVQGVAIDRRLGSPMEAPSSRTRKEVVADFANSPILVVEADVATRELLTLLLTGCRARVTAVESPQAALESVQREVPALIVSDIKTFGEDDGLSLMKRIRKLPAERGGTVPGLALSAYTRDQDKTLALAAGFTEFLAKPTFPDDVVRAAQRLLVPSLQAEPRL